MMDDLDTERRSIGDKRWVRVTVWIIVALMLLPVLGFLFRLLGS